MQGSIQRLIRGKGFGFILADGRQYFFHHSAVKDIEFKQLTLGDVVEFQSEADEQDRNPRAIEIVVIEKKERVPKPPPRPAPKPARKSPPRGRKPLAQGGSRERKAPWPSPRGSADPRRPAESGLDGELVGDDDEIFRDFGMERDGEGEFVEEFPSATPSEEPRPRPRRHAPARSQGRNREERRPRAAGPPGTRGEGVVRAMDLERGFGFIETSGGDIFFHRTAVTDGFENLNVGSRVAFVFGQGDRGSKAENVSVL
jgi:cold shock CspA family protein